MRLRLRRIALRDTYTIGKLEVFHWGEWKWIADTIEDKVRDLNKSGKFDNGEVKIASETAIPYGTYKITLDVKSPKFSNYEFYKKYCDGYLPRLVDVPHFEGILLHCAEGPKGAKLVQGCIGIGENTIIGGLTKCKQTFIKVYDLLKNATDEIWIEIM